MTTVPETNKPDEKQNENRKPRPAYYAVIPADVRYDSKLPQGAKLLYGEITALCNRKGFCWARNAYFAKLYQKDERTVNRWIKALKDGGYITVSFTFAPGSKEVDDRIICLTKPKAEPPGDNGEDAPSGPGSPPPDGRNDGPPEGDGSREVVTFLSGGGDTGVTAYGQNDRPDPPGPPEDSGENASFRPLNPQNPPENGYNGPPEGDGGQEAAAFLPGGGDTGVTTPGHFCQGVVTFLSGGGDIFVRGW